MKRRVLMTAMVLFAILAAAPAIGQAEIPQVISYQGKVTDGSGNPVADATYTMRFRIYDAAAAGTMLWDSGNQNVAVAGGIFSVLLGESPQPALNLAFDEDYWLLVTFAGADQSPRQRLASSGYAYMASGLVPGTEVSGSVTTGTLAAFKVANTATSGITYGVYGSSSSTDGRGLFGYATATSGTTYGVAGRSSSSSGRAFYGWASATSGTTYGGWFESSSSSGRAVYGHATAGTGETYGGRFENGSTDGRAVFAHAYSGSGTTYAVYGKADSPSGYAIYGANSATTGSAIGVVGQSSSTAGIGVWGLSTSATGSAWGGRFDTSSDQGACVYGVASASTGPTYGAYFHNLSTSGCAVVGDALATTGSTHGVVGTSNSPAGFGVLGVAWASSGTAYGVYGRSDSPSGKGVYFEGGLAGSGTKSCVVRTSRGPTLLYCQESPENWFEDFGEGYIVDGRCHIELDPLFVETVTIDAANPMHVFLQPNDEACVGLVVKKGISGFDVVSPLDRSATGAFSYRVVAKRKGFEASRLDVCEAALSDSHLYPELREKENRERAEELSRIGDEMTRLEADLARIESQRPAAVRAPEADE